jgi:hypothetical protein
MRRMTGNKLESKDPRYVLTIFGLDRGNVSKFFRLDFVLPNLIFQLNFFLHKRKLSIHCIFFSNKGLELNNRLILLFENAPGFQTVLSILHTYLMVLCTIFCRSPKCRTTKCRNTNCRNKNVESVSHLASPNLTSPT